MKKTLFQRIIDGEIPSDKILETDNLVVFHDINPVAQVHVLIVTKKPYKDLNDIPESELGIISEVIKTSQILSRQLRVSDCYRLQTHIGVGGGQSVFHLHFHLIGGKQIRNLITNTN